MEMKYSAAYGKDKRNHSNRVSLTEADYDEGYLSPVPCESSSDPPLPAGYSYVTPARREQPMRENNQPESHLYTDIVQ